MNDLYLSSMASSLNQIADNLSCLATIEDDLDGVMRSLDDINETLQYLTDRLTKEDDE